MKDLIKTIVNTLNKENRRNRKIISEQYKQIIELSENVKFLTSELETHKKRIRQLEHKNTELNKANKLVAKSLEESSINTGRKEKSS